MAIQDDWTIDVVDLKITYTGGFTDGIPDSIYTMLEWYQWLQDVFDEPEMMQYAIPVTAQTPTQYTIVYPWFIDDESVKALYSGSLQTSGYTYGSSAGVTQLWWTSGSTDPPNAGDIGEDVIVGATTKKGTILAVDTTRRICWVRNTDATQFVAGDNVVGDGTSGIDFDIEANDGAQQGVRNGDSVWPNFYSVGTIQNDTEIYAGQEDEWHGGSTIPKLTKLTSWWDEEQDFTGGLNGAKAGHFDVLIKMKDAGTWIDDLNLTNQGRAAFFARQGRTVYSHYETATGGGNNVVPFASTGFDINQAGFVRVTTGSWSGGTGDFDVGEIVTQANSGAKGRVSARLLDTWVEVVVLGKDLTAFDGSNVITGEDSGTSATASGTSNVNGATDNGVSITLGETAVDVDQDGTDEHYAGTIDCNNQPLAEVYERLMYWTRRGSTEQILPEPGSGTGGYEDGEFFRNLGDAYITVDAKSGGDLELGEKVTGGTSLATGELVAWYWSGSAGYLYLTNVKGSFVNNDVITGEVSAETMTASADQETLVDNTGSPFGSFAGGRFFVARGWVLTNVPGADGNNWETSDVAGDAYAPPTSISLTFAGLKQNDRATVLEVATAGGIDVVKTTVGVAAGSKGDGTVTLDATVAADVPSASWVRVVDTSVPGQEQRLEFSARSGTTVTLRSVAPGDGTCDSGGSTTRLIDAGGSGIGSNFGTDGNCKVGHVIRNTTTDEHARVLRAVSSTEIETTPVASGWNNTNTYEVNKVVWDIAADDTCYFPFLDDTITADGNLSESLVFVHTTEILARARFSDPDVGGTRYLPFELLDQQITNADLTITAIRTSDSIASL